MESKPQTPWEEMIPSDITEDVGRMLSSLIDCPNSQFKDTGHCIRYRLEGTDTYYELSGYKALDALKRRGVIEYHYATEADPARGILDIWVEFSYEAHEVFEAIKQWSRL